MRTLVRHPLAAPPTAGWRERTRRLLAGLAVTVVAGVVVVGLGLLAEAAAGVRGGADPASAPSGVITVMVGSERNSSPTPVSLRPGQVLSVTPG